MSSPTSRSVVFDRFGGPEVLHVATRPLPVPGPGEVVVRVVAATINPTDTLMRSGQHASLMTSLVPPYIAGMEFSGHVQQLGPGATRLKPGQAVVALVNPRRPQGGAHAEHVCLPEASVVAAPIGVDLVAAATLPMNGMTAKMVLELLGLPKGATLLVTGGAGALGGYVIQLARHAGLTVLAEAKDADRELISRFGATVLLPRGDGFVQAVRSHSPQGVDGLADCALLGDTAAALVKDGGTVVAVRRTLTYGESPRVTVKPVGVLEQAGNTEGLAWVAGLAQAGVLTPRVARLLPFTQAAEANRLVDQGGLRGRVVLLP